MKKPIDPSVGATNRRMRQRKSKRGRVYYEVWKDGKCVDCGYAKKTGSDDSRRREPLESLFGYYHSSALSGGSDDGGLLGGFGSDDDDWMEDFKL